MRALRADGFCWLEFDTALTARIKALGGQLEAFFEQDSAKKAHAPCYSAVRGVKADGKDGAVFKEKISLVSGDRLPKALPPVSGLESFVHDTDNLLARVVHVLRDSCVLRNHEPIPLGEHRSQVHSNSAWLTRMA